MTRQRYERPVRTMPLPVNERRNPDSGRRGGDELRHFARFPDPSTPQPAYEEPEIEEPEIDEDEVRDI